MKLFQLKNWVAASFYEIVYLILNYSALLFMPKIMGVDIFDSLSQVISISSIFSVIIVFGSNNWVYKWNKPIKNIFNQIGSIYFLRFIIFILILIVSIFLDYNLDFKKNILAGLLAFITALSPAAFYDLIERTKKFSHAKFISILSVLILSFFYYYFYSIEITFIEGYLFILLIQLSILIISISKISYLIKSVSLNNQIIKSLVSESWPFFIAATITIIFDYFIVISTSEVSTGVQTVSLFFLAKFSVGFKTIDSSLQRILIIDFRNKPNYNYLFKVFFIRFALLLTLCFAVLILNSVFKIILGEQIWREILNFAFVWLIFMTVNLFSHFGTAIYLNISNYIFMNIIILKALILFFGLLILKSLDQFGIYQVLYLMIFSVCIESILMIIFYTGANKE